jgi:hypothetical protein
VFRNSTGYNESIETPIATLAPSSVGVKKIALRYVCDFLESDSKIELLTSSTSVFLGARMLCYIIYMAFPKWHR